jgi:TPR repeat protein
MFQLATRYDLGEQGEQDPSLAFRWYRRAADAGLPEAEFNVAVMLDSGRGVGKNLTEAANWYGRAAARGNRRAQYNLALLYDAGEGVPHNAALATFWLRQAAPAIPAVGRRLARLRPEDRATTVSAATPGVPREQVATGKAPLEFVWTAAAQPESVRYLVEVYALGLINSAEVYSEFIDGSAVVAPLREKPGEYAWRVFTLDRVAARYAVSNWVHFTVSPSPAIGASIGTFPAE